MTWPEPLIPELLAELERATRDRCQLRYDMASGAVAIGPAGGPPDVLQGFRDLVDRSGDAEVALEALLSAVQDWMMEDLAEEWPDDRGGCQPLVQRHENGWALGFGAGNRWSWLADWPRPRPTR